MIYLQTSWTPLHTATFNDHASTCQLMCAFDGVEENAVTKRGETALAMAVHHSKVDSLHALLELNVDTSKARVAVTTTVEITQLLEEHRKRSVKLFILLFLFERILLIFSHKLF